ncbi:MAG: DNA polymerase III subunit beta [Candidatus Roizmanbacteria bacterium]
MKINLLKEVFLEKLNLTSRFTSSKLTSSTSLQGVCLVGEKDLLHFYSTNLNYYYHSTLKIENSHSFKVIIEARKIEEFLSLLSSERIDFEIKEKQVIITQGKTRASFPLYESSEFPFPPKMNNEKQKIKTEFIKNNLSLVLFSASSDETRPILTGINFVSSEDSVQMVATDGFRLSLLSLKKEFPIPSMIIPSSFLNEVIRLLKNEESIYFSYSTEEKMLVFYIGEHELYTRLIEGDYPQFEKVIPSEKKTTITIDREEFLRKVKLTSIFARDFSNVIIIKTDKEGLKIYPKTTKDDEENITYQEAIIEGEEQKIAFNYKFVIDFLNNVSSKKVIIELLRSDAPAVFRSENIKNLIHIIMPVRIQD